MPKDNWPDLLNRLLLATISLEQVRQICAEEGSMQSYHDLVTAARSFDICYRDVASAIDDQ